MTRAETFSRRGVVIVEYALTPGDLARMAAAFDRDAATTAVWSWLETHAALTALATELAGEAAACCAIERATLDAGCPTWFEGWHRGHETAHAAVELTVYLDACDETAGPVEVRIGSHRRDLSPPLDVPETGLCVCAPGDILALHPAVLRRRQRPARPSAGRLIRWTAGRRLVERSVVSKAPERTS